MGTSKESTMSSSRVLDPLDPTDRHRHTPAAEAARRNFYEWWYLEVEFDVDDPKHGREQYRVITSLHFPHGLDPLRVLTEQRYDPGAGPPFRKRFPCDPDRYPGVATYVVRTRKGVRENIALLITRLKDAAVVSASTAGLCRLQWSDVASLEERTDGTWRVEIHQVGRNEGGLGLKLDFRADLTPVTAGFRPQGGVLVDDGVGTHHWACILPNPRSRILKLGLCKGAQWLLRDEDLPHATGTGGYLDHQWGHDFIHRRIAEWSWGRLNLPAPGRGHGDRIVFFDIVARGPAGGPSIHPPAVLAHAPASGGTSRALDPIGGTEPFKPLVPQIPVGIKPIRARGIEYYPKLRLWGQDGATQYKFTIDHSDAALVDVWPFYLRFVTSATSVDGTRAEAISEYMRSDRMHLPKVQRALAWSRIITTTEPGAVKWRVIKSPDACDP
jgi:hypothetical protein